MSTLTIAAIAVALAMDAFAVAIAAGISLKQITFRQNFRLAWHFGLFQALMPVIGWSAGLSFRDLIVRFDHWVAFALLLFVAQGMLRQAIKNEDSDGKSTDPTKGVTMVMLSVATSLDALAVGLSLSMVDVSIWIPAVIIGIVACAFTTIGMHIGKRLANATPLRRWADVFGAVVLLIIGINILRVHGVFDGMFS